MVYSFDVYDTLITRVCAEPAGIFVYMQKLLSDTDSCADIPQWFVEDFVRIRKESELLARRKHRSREITLTDIYKEMRCNYRISEAVCKRISVLEMQMEIQCAVAIQENVDRIEQLTRSEDQVILISDMYMGRTFFEELFSCVCPSLNQYPLYLSSETGATKSSGKLFILAAAREHLSREKWQHTGDHAFFDVGVPNLLGIGASLFQKKTDTSSSSRIHAILRETNSAAAQFLVGIQNHHSFLTGSIGYRIGYSFLGMILYEYVTWVIRQAVSLEIEVLHFIARDGYLLKQLADILIEESDLPIRTNYLYGSRKAWRTTDEAEQNLVRAYLHQEVLGKGEHFAFVDAQGTGLSLDMIPCLEGERIPVFYYSSPTNYTSKNSQPYIYTLQTGRRVIEVLCRAPHGLTTGYTKQDGKVVPVIAPLPNERFVNCGFFEYCTGVTNFARSVLLFQSRTGISLSFADAAQHAMQYCENTPDRQLADFLGEFPFETSPTGEEYVYAPPLPAQDLIHILFERKQKLFQRVYPGTNIEYSYHRLDQEGQEEIAAYQKNLYSQSVNKNADAMHIVIFGCGRSGKSFYRTIYLDEAVVVDKVVDPDPNSRRNAPFKTEPVSSLLESTFDYVVVSRDYSSNIRALKELLALAGFDVEKVLIADAFWAMHSQ